MDIDTKNFDLNLFFRFGDKMRRFFKKILTKLRFRTSQSCAFCGRDQHVIWGCSDDNWIKIPEEYHNTALCLECFVVLYPEDLNIEDIDILGYC